MVLGTIRFVVREIREKAFEAYLREAEKAVQNNIPIQEASAYIKRRPGLKFTKGDDLAEVGVSLLFPRAHNLAGLPKT